MIGRPRIVALSGHRVVGTNSEAQLVQVGLAEQNGTGRAQTASDCRVAVGDVLREGKMLTYDLGGAASCSAVGKALAEAVAR